MRARSRARTSRAELFSPHSLLLWPSSSHYLCFQLSAYTLELIYTFEAFVEVPTYNFSFFFFTPFSFLVQCHLQLFPFRNETAMSCCLNLALFHFETGTWKMGVAKREECVCNYDCRINAAMVKKLSRTVNNQNIVFFVVPVVAMSTAAPSPRPLCWHLKVGRRCEGSIKGCLRSVPGNRQFVDEA